MRELKLKYVIELLSDIGAKTARDERAMTEAQRRVQTALGETNQKIGLVERALLHMGGVGTATVDRQAAYLGKLALRYHDVRKAAEGAHTAMTRAAAFSAGAAAGAMAVDRMTRAPIEYSQRLAGMANTAFSDRDAAGRIAGKRTLDAAINTALKVAGGKRDDAAGALDFLIASGAMPPETAMKMLPMVMRSSTASGAAPEQIAGIGVRAMQGFGIGLDQMPQALNMAMAAGQAGGFELKDMARWLPQAMAAGGQSGLSGIEGLRRILGSMQASVITAGTKDEAGNNLVNLLAKINSADTAKDFAKQGINLQGALVDARSKGVNSLDAFVGLMDQVAAKDPAYVALQAKLAGTSNKGEQGQMLQSMAALLQGGAVGTVIQDRQAMMALVAEMNNRKYIQTVMGRTRSDTNAIGTAFDVMSQDTAFKRESAGSAMSDSTQRAFDALAPGFNAVFDGASKLGREFPLLTAAVVGAAGTISAIAAGMGASGLIGMLTGRAGAGVVATTLAGAAAAAAPIAGVAAAGGFAGWQAWRLGSALSDLSAVKNREGVVLSQYAKERLGKALPAGAQAPGMPRALDLLQITGPGTAPMQLGPGQARELKIGDGRLSVDVKVSDERVSATASVAQPMSLVRLATGGTNPAGYGR